VDVCDLVTFGKTPSLDKNKFLYEYKVLWNRIVKRIKILILKGFGVVYIICIVKEWCGILIIHKQ